MFRSLFAGAILALLPALGAQVFYAEPAGYTRQEIPLGDIPGGFVTFPGGATFDGSGNLYYWDGVSVRRMADDAPPLFTMPQQGVFGIYVDDMTFDPNSPADLYVIESGKPGLYKMTLSGLDELAATPTYVDYSATFLYLYDLEFDPVSGQLFACGAAGFGVAPDLFVIDLVTLAATKVADITSVANGSGPIAFDANGNLYTTVPAPFGSNGPIDFVRFPAARIAAALAANPIGSLVLDGENAGDANMPIVQADGFMNAAHMGIRTEGGNEILYFTGTDEGTIYRCDLDAGGAPVATMLADGIGPTHDPSNNDFNGASALAIESRTGDFAGDGSGLTRIVTFNSFYLNANNFDFQLFAANVFRPKPTTAGYVAAAGLRVASQPVAAEAGTAFGLQVEIVDELGARVTTGADSALPVTVAISTGDGNLTGTLTINAVAGLATFVNLTLDAAGSVRLGLFAPALYGATTNPITVFAATRNLSFSLQPTSVLRDAAFSVTVEIRDGAGTLVNVGPSSTAPVTIALASGAGVLSGTATVNAVGGVATFNGLSLNVTGVVTLEVTSPGMANATSLTIAVVAVEPQKTSGGGGSCSGGDGYAPCLLLAVLIGLAIYARRRRVSVR